MRRQATIVLVLGLALALAGCGDDGGADAAVDDTPTTGAASTEATIEPTTTEAPETTASETTPSTTEVEDDPAPAGDYCSTWAAYVASIEFVTAKADIAANLTEQLTVLADVAVLAPPELAADVATVTATIEAAQIAVDQATTDDEALAAIGPPLQQPEQRAAATRLADYSSANCA